MRTIKPSVWVVNHCVRAINHFIETGLSCKNYYWHCDSWSFFVLFSHPTFELFTLPEPGQVVNTTGNSWSFFVAFLLTSHCRAPLLRRRPSHPCDARSYSRRDPGPPARPQCPPNKTRRRWARAPPRSPMTAPSLASRRQTSSEGGREGGRMTGMSAGICVILIYPDKENDV